MMQTLPQMPIPVVLLTGFLGAGKTTLVNRILRDAHGLRLAVIVNEFGEIGIDAQLIVGASGGLVQLENGCICCATRGDLAGAIHEILSSDHELDGILIETSGLADPFPVIDDIESLEFARPTRLDGVITILDAENFDRNLSHAEAAYQQIVAADLLLINKSDLVDREVLSAIARGSSELNPGARSVPCTDCELPLELIISSRLDRAGHRAHVHEHREAHAHHHAHSFTSVSLRSQGTPDRDRFTRWLDELPGAIHRVKGFVRFADTSATYVIHKVGSRLSMDLTAARIGDAGAVIVMIGLDLDEERLRSEFSDLVST
ncbi:MAG: GTP-binding protein [Burkholderiaceae bacterium]